VVVWRWWILSGWWWFDGLSVDPVAVIIDGQKKAPI
jgi:hypothetical protein